MVDKTDVVSKKSEGDFEEIPKPVLATILVINGKWKIPIIWLLWVRPRRFGELRKAMSTVTQHMLTVSLRELERDGLVHRTVHKVTPPHVEYALTKKSLALCDVFKEMQKWGEQYMVER
jgi:DNA-binding HxlR family transcriptional regulator